MQQTTCSQITLLLEGKNRISFPIFGDEFREFKMRDIIGQKLCGIKVTHTPFHDGNVGIFPMLRDFETDVDGVITFIPSLLNLCIEDEFIVIKYGSMETPRELFDTALAGGIAAYWDSYNFIICFKSDCFEFAEQIAQIIQPNKGKIKMTVDVLGASLIISEAK